MVLTCVGFSPWSNRVSPFLPGYVSGPWCLWPCPFLRKGLAYVCRSLGALLPGGQACASAWHGWISYPNVPPRGCSMEFPRRGTSWVTHVTMVPRGETRRCVPSLCLRPACLRLLQTTKLVTYSAITLLYFRAPCLWRHGPCGPIGLVLFHTCFRHRSCWRHSPMCPLRGAASRSLSGNHG